MHSDQALINLITPKPYPKGMSETAMAADMAFKRKTAQLAAAVKKRDERG